nr:pilus assembly protein [Polymorphobacter sp.]
MTAEFSLTIPVLLVMFFGLFQVGTLFIANAGLKNGIGEAARLATLYPRRSDDTIIQRLRSASYGINSANLTNVVISHGIAQGTDYTEISASYTVPMNMLVVTLPSITLSESRRVYVP